MKKNCKILILSHSFVKKVNLSFALDLSKKNNLDVSCVVPIKISQSNKNIYPDYKKKNINLNIFSADLVNKSMRLQYFKNIRQIIEKKKPNIIFLDNDTVCLQSLILIFWSFFFNYKINYFCNENNLINLFKTFTLKKLLKLCIIYFVNLIIKYKVNKIICYSKQIKDNYNFLGYKNKSEIIPLGFDKKTFFIKTKKKLKKKLVISYFGRINEEKGIHVLIKSLKYLKEYNWKLVIDSEHIENFKYFLHLKNLIKKSKIKQRTKFIKCNHNQVANFMRKSDIIVLPSIYEEQYGRVIQEGVACGNVAVGSKIGAIPEIINDSSLLFKPGDYRALSVILKKLFNKKFYLSKLYTLRKDVNKKRTIDYQIKKTCKFCNI